MKNWWKSFFIPVTSEIMFKPKQGKQTQQEVKEVLRQLNQPKKLKILDLCCGEGRHSVLFAKRGHQVSGLDLTNDFLTTAKQNAKKMKLNIDFVRGDMKKTSTYFLKNNFDLVVSLYNSFGFFDRKSDDLKTLKEVHQVLKPGGIFIINTINGDGVLHRIQKPISNGHEISPDLFLIEKAEFNQKKMIVSSKWTVIDARKGKTKINRLEFKQNVYSHQQLKKMLKQSGFKVIKTWGVLSGGEFQPKTSWHQTIIAKKVKQ